MKRDIKVLISAFIVAAIVQVIAISFNFTKGTPAILGILTFMFIYFMGKLERIENKLDKLNSIKRRK